MGTPDSSVTEIWWESPLWSHQRHYSLWRMSHRWHVTLCWLVWSDVSSLRLTHYIWSPDTRTLGPGTQATQLAQLFSVLLRSQSDLEQWTDQTKCRPDTHIVFIWMFVGDTRLFEVGAGESWLIMSCPGQARLAWAPVNVTFISQPPSNQMSLFPTYLITVLIYGIISYQTQNLPQLKLWQSGPLTPLHVWRIHVLGHFLPFQSPDPCVPCHTVTPQTAGKTNIPSLIHQMNENFLTNELKME